MSEKFNKTDMERVALFQEMGYISIGDEYHKSNTKPNNVKMKQLLPGGSKTKNATQAGYFADRFQRVLEGEAYSDQAKMRRQNRMKEAQRSIGKPFVPSSGNKLMSGLGSNFGTFSGSIPALNPQVKSGKEYKSSGKNFYTNPGKKGTGYGYSGVTIGRYHEYNSDKYDKYREISRRENEEHKKAMNGGAFHLNMAPKAFFDENPFRSDRQIQAAKKVEERKWDIKPFKPSSPGKQDGGMKAGTFDPYPSHSNDLYKVKIKHQSSASTTGQKSRKTFMPPAGPKSAPINSVLNQNIVRTLNVQNYRTARRIMSY